MRVLDSYVAVVTGGGSCIDRAIAKLYVREIARLKFVAGLHPFGRLGSSEEVAELAR